MDEVKSAKLAKLLKAEVDRNEALEVQLSDFKQRQGHLVSLLKSIVIRKNRPFKRLQTRVFASAGRDRSEEDRLPGQLHSAECIAKSVRKSAYAR